MDRKQWKRRGICPKCHAVYDINALPDGASFECKCCGTRLVLNSGNSQSSMRLKAWTPSASSQRRIRAVTDSVQRIPGPAWMKWAVAGSLAAVLLVGWISVFIPADPAPLQAGDAVSSTPESDASAADWYEYALSLDKNERKKFEAALQVVRAKDPSHPGALGQLQRRFHEQMAEVDSSDVMAHIRIAEWARAMRLSDEEKSALKRVILLEPEHVEARRRLGFVKTETGWEKRTDGESWEVKAQVLQNKLLAELDPSGEEGGSFSVLWSKPYVLLVQQSPKYQEQVILNQYSNLLIQLSSLFLMKYQEKLNLSEIERPLPVIVFSNRTQYDEYNMGAHGSSMPSLIGGHYEYHSRRLIMYHGVRTPFEVVMHEGTHQILHYYTTGSQPHTSLWFQEGFATYFEAFRRNPKGKLVLEVVNKERLDVILDALQDVNWVPFDKLVEITPDDFWAMIESKDRSTEEREKLARLYYAEAWALTWFLRNAENGKYSKQLDLYIGRELKGEGGPQAFREVFGDLESLEREWVRFMETMRDR